MSTKSNTCFFKMISHFCIVSNYKQIKKAAEILGLQQTNLSHEIQELEKILDTTLIIKTNRGINLTEDGQALYEQAKILINNIEKIQDYFKVKNEKKSVTVRIPSAGIYALQDQIDTFKKIYPDVLCNFTIDELTEYGTLNDIDIYATYSHHIWNNTEPLLTGKQKFTFVCSKKYIEKNGVPKSLEEILYERHLCICPTHLKYDENYTKYCEMARYLDFKVSNFSLIISLIFTRDIIAVIPKYMAKVFPEFVCIDLSEWSLSLPNRILINKDTMHKKHVLDMAQRIVNLYKDVEKEGCFEDLKINNSIFE